MKVRIIFYMLLLGMSVESFSQIVYVQDLYLESVKQNNISKVSEYLDAGIDVNITSPNYPSKNALMIAVQNNNMEMIQFLLDRGVDPSITIRAAIFVGGKFVFPSALIYAIYEENYDLVTFLADELLKRSKTTSIEEGYKFAQDMEDRKAMDTLEKTGYIISKKDAQSEELTEQKIQVFNAKYSKLKQRDLKSGFPDIEKLIATDKSFIKYLKEIKKINITYDFIINIIKSLWLRPYRDIETDEIGKHFTYITDLYDIDIKNEFLKDESTPKFLTNSVIMRSDTSERQQDAFDILFTLGLSPLDIPKEYLEKQTEGSGFLKKIYRSDIAEYILERQKEARKNLIDD